MIKEFSPTKEVQDKRKLYTHYYANFEKHLANGNVSKASEFLWGALHSLIYAIGITYGLKLSKHQQIKEFMKDLSLEEEDTRLYELFKKGEQLHANFYHDFLDAEALSLMGKEIYELIDKLIKILDSRMIKLDKSKINSS